MPSGTPSRTLLSALSSADLKSITTPRRQCRVILNFFTRYSHVTCCARYADLSPGTSPFLTYSHSLATKSSRSLISLSLSRLSSSGRAARNILRRSDLLRLFHRPTAKHGLEVSAHLTVSAPVRFHPLPLKVPRDL